MVASATLRPAALLVKAVTTLDVLSGGRPGSASGRHQQAEADGMGVPFPPSPTGSTRWRTLRLARRMWSGDDAPFDGHRFHAARPIGSPAPTTAPHPPILIGGIGERRTLRLVARYADACNLPDVADGGDLIRHKLAVLAEHCARRGTTVRRDREDREHAAGAGRTGRRLRRTRRRARRARTRPPGRAHPWAVDRRDARRPRQPRSRPSRDIPTAAPARAVAADHAGARP